MTVEVHRIETRKTVAPFTRLLRLILLLAAFSACRPGNKPKIDEFYTQKGEWDSARIPFIKPYEAFSIGTSTGWNMSLKAYQGLNAVEHIERANIVNNVILLYNTNILLHGVAVKESWYIIIPGKHVEKGYSSHDKYTEELGKLGFPTEPKLLPIEKIARYVDRHEFMDWKHADFR